MRIRIKTPSRLHFTLIDENGQIGRVDGGIGLTIHEPNFEAEFIDRRSIPKELNETGTFVSIPNRQILFSTVLGDVLIICDRSDVKDPNVLLSGLKDIVINFITKFSVEFNITNSDKISDKFPIIIKVNDYLYSHLGFGSKTQISLALAKGILRLIEKEIPIEKITELVSRGGTSGIGYRSFERGGFILDCGHRFGPNQEKTTFLPSSASNAKPARTVVRLHFPEEWVILVITLNVPQGASNTDEINAFQKYCPVPLQEVQEISHIILMKVIPGIIERDLNQFGSGINQVQELGFKKIEIQLQHDEVKRLMKFQRDKGCKCVGMSSFGPTVYGIFESIEEAEKVLNQAIIEFEKTGFKFYITCANNKGAEFEVLK